MKSVFETDIQQKYPALSADIKTSIAVIGGGIAGLLSAYQLSQEGFEVSLFEARQICSATSAKSTAVLTGLQSAMYYNNTLAADYFFAQKTALEMYEKLIKKHQIDCDFTKVPSYLYATNEKNEKLLKKEYTAMRSFTDAVEYTNCDFGKAIKLDGQAQFNVVKFLHALPKKFAIYENTRIVDFDLDKNVFKTAQGHKIEAEKVVIATRFPAILNNFYYFKMYQTKSYVVSFKHPPLNATFNSMQDNGLYMRSYGDHLLLGGFDHRAGKHKKGENYYERLKAKAQQLFRVKDSDFGESWSAEDVTTFDGIPFAGNASAKHKNAYVITGFNEWGMLNAMICARVITNKIAKKTDEFENIFNPQRAYLTANLGSFMHHALGATASLTRGLFQEKKRCAHIGCGLRFNSIENVYECPCHGSRFDKHGNLLDGPAVCGIKGTEADN